MSDKGNLFANVLKKPRNRTLSIKSGGADSDNNSDAGSAKNEPGSLFANVLKKKIQPGGGASATKKVEDDVVSNASSQPGKRKLFVKKRNAANTQETHESVRGEEEKKEEEKKEEVKQEEVKQEEEKKADVTADNADEPQPETNNPALDSLFAAAPVERSTNANKKAGKRRDLSENFLSNVNNNNLAEQVKPTTKKKEERPRSSVIDNIAMFQGNIDKSTGRTKPDSQNDVKVRRVNVDDGTRSDVSGGDGSRSSVKDLILQFNSGIGSEKERPSSKLRNIFKQNKRDTVNSRHSRQSLGDAFIEKALKQQNDITPQKADANNQAPGGFRLGGNKDGRMSIGDQFVANLKNKKNDTTDDQSDGSANRGSNIFNKLRAQKDTRSDIDRESYTSSTQKIQQRGDAIVQRDDGGNLISFDQMALLAKDDNRKSSFTKTSDMRAKKGRKSTMKIRMNKSGMADSINSGNDINNMVDRLDKSPVSHDPTKLVRQKSSGEIKLKRLEDASMNMTNKIFDFTNQMNDLKQSALDHRSNSRRDSRISHNSMNSSGLNTSTNKLRGVKKIGSLVEKEKREKEKQDRSDMERRSRPSADIIITRELDENGNQTGKSHRSDNAQKNNLIMQVETDQFKSAEFGVAATAAADQANANNNNDQSISLVEPSSDPTDRTESIQLAATAEPYRNQPKGKRRDSETHENIGLRVAAQEHRHATQEREFKLQYESKGAKKLNQRVAVKKQVSAEPQSQDAIFSANNHPDEVQDKLNKTVTDQQKGPPLNDISQDQTRIVNHQSSARIILNKSSERVGDAYGLSSKRSGQGDKSPLDKSLMQPSQNSKNRNNDFVEYVVGADTLFPKRVRSKKSDLPYSQGSYKKSNNSNRSKHSSADAYDIQGLQEQLNKEGSMDRSMQQINRSRSNIKNSERRSKRGESFDHQSKGFLLNQSQNFDAKQDEDLNEVERRIAEQERELKNVVEGVQNEGDSKVIAQGGSQFRSAKPGYKGNKTIEMQGNNQIGQEDLFNKRQNVSGLDQSNLDNLQNEIELEELQREEQRKLEQAIQQDGEGVDQTMPSHIDASKAGERPDRTNNRSHLDFDVSNIQHNAKNNDSSRDISAMQAKIDAIDGAGRAQTALKDKRQSGISGLPDISDVTDPHALNKNYLEKSATDDASIDIAKNQREQQLRYELEILELELELQMNEADMSDDDSDDNYTTNQARVAALKQNRKQMHGSGGANFNGVHSPNINQNKGKNTSHDFKVNQFWTREENSMQGRSKLSNLTSGNKQKLNISKMLSNNSQNDMSSQWGFQQERHEKIVMPINLEDQEVLCSKCYETIPMNLVDTHSTTCFIEEPSFRMSTAQHRGNVTVDEEQEYSTKSEELNERIFKLIQTFLRKLDSQVFLDQIYTTHGNEDNSNGHQSQNSNNNKGGKKASQDNSTPQNQFSKPNKSATALAEERSLIHEVVQHAHLALQGELYDVQNSAEQLDLLEEEHDLNQKFDFNNHMVYNRVVQVINIKLEVMQEWEKRINPDIVVPMTTKQMKEREDRLKFGFQELSLANVQRLPLHAAAAEQQDPSKHSTKQNSRLNSQERQLHEYIQASKAQAMQQRSKKRNIFQNKKHNSGTSDGVAENWILSDMDSDTNSAGGHSQQSYNSFKKPRFKSNSVLAKKRKD